MTQKGRRERSESERRVDEFLDDIFEESEEEERRRERQAAAEALRQVREAELRALAGKYWFK